ncbi:heavy-metal-associated domain-containing protein [Thiolinea disciformis]|uniref:heavy-metal-associated domain-containing protein n=1 Tax=Thiolinea disciformis TaxID=125614 RepID=UPI00035D1635|nr:heavy metal-associated domain-containing protein [Thiolinea disciformis]
MKFKVEKMMCSGCTSTVKAKLEALAGVTAVRVDLASGTAEVEGTIIPQQVIDTLQAAGYPTRLQSA